MSTIENFLSIIDFSERLGVHPATIRRMIKKNRINALKIGSGTGKLIYRIPESELQRLGIFDIEKIIEKEIDKRMKGKL